MCAVQYHPVPIPGPIALPHSLRRLGAEVGALEVGRWDSGTRDAGHLKSYQREGLQKPSVGQHLYT